MKTKNFLYVIGLVCVLFSIGAGVDFVSNFYRAGNGIDVTSSTISAKLAAGDNVILTTNSGTITIAGSSNLTINVSYTSNLFVTNIAYIYETYTTNLYVATNLYVTNQTFLNETYVTNVYISTNLYVTNIAYINNLYATNLYVTNGWITNLYVQKLTVNTNVYYLEGANNIYTVATNDTTTNVVPNFTNSVQTIRFTNNITLLQSTNRPVGETNLAMTLLIFYNSSGGDLTVSTNNALGWKIDGTSFPVTVTNGDCQTFTLTAWGPYETNVVLGSKWFH